MPSNQSLTLVGLNTLRTNVTESTSYVVQGKLTCPQLAQGASDPSQVVVTVSQNSSLKYTSLPGQEGFKTELSCTAGDEIEITTASSAAVDQDPNAIKVVVGVSNGT